MTNARTALALSAALLLAAATPALAQRRAGAAKAPSAAALAARREKASAALALARARHVRDRDADAAARATLEASAIDPSFPDPLADLAALSESRGDWAGAKSWYEKYLALDPAAPDAPRIQRRLSHLQTLADPAAPEEARRQARRELLLSRARERVSEGRLGDAMVAAAEAAGLGDGWDVDAVVAAALVRAGRLAEAVEALDRAIAAAPEAEKPALRQARDGCARHAASRRAAAASAGALRAKSYVLAAEELMEAWRKDPALEELGLAAAAAYVLDGQRPRAVEILERLRHSTRPAVAARASEMLSRLPAPAPQP